MESQDVKAMHESGASQDEILAEMILQSYDKFNLEIQNIQAIVAAPTEDWQSTILENNVTEMHILQPTTLKLSAHLCVIEDDPRLPKCKISGEIPKIHINVTENRVMDAYSIVTSLPLPENEEVQPKLLNKESNILSSSLSLLKFLDEKQKTISLSNKSEKPASDDLVDELVQFTDLEIKLVMSGQ
jgi:vacuolar protein sorting-associated protein 13A/C